MLCLPRPTCTTTLEVSVLQPPLPLASRLVRAPRQVAHLVGQALQRVGDAQEGAMCCRRTLGRGGQRPLVVRSMGVASAFVDMAGHISLTVLLLALARSTQRKRKHRRKSSDQA